MKQFVYIAALLYP